MYGTKSTPSKNGTKDKYDPNHAGGSTRMYTIMSPDDAAAGKKSSWHELEITGTIRNLSSTLWMFNHLTSLYLNDNQLVHVPPDIVNLHNLVRLDLSSNKLRSLPPEMGDMVTLEELYLQNNQLRNLPRELGRLFRLHILGLNGNPLPAEIMSPYMENNGVQKLLEAFLENLPVTAPQPPPRSWIKVNDSQHTGGVFTVMCYNVLCDKYATKQQYGYCPCWALSWEYRKKNILDELKQSNSDIIALQEVETDQYYNYFLPALKEQDYEGIFSPKSRARTISESERKYVDGCAIFYRKSKFTLVKEHLIEFNQLAISAVDRAEGSHDMINRVMTKDNIALAALLETKPSFWQSGQLPSEKAPMILVATCHIHWDPEYCDVKLIQTMMLMHELRNIVDEAQTSLRPRSGPVDVNSLPVILCGDLNSLPDSGVVEYLTHGRVSASHVDFKDHGYADCLRKYSPQSDVYGHNFLLSQAYNEDTMPFTNFTYYFRGVIDYIFYTRQMMRPLSVLGATDMNWFVQNKVFGCPHPYMPSDHLPLLVQFELGGSAPQQQPGQQTNRR